MLFITIIVYTVFIIIAMTGNEFINWAYLGFEVYLPLFVAIMVCKYVSVCGEPLFESIKYSKDSLFLRIIKKYINVYVYLCGVGFLFCIFLRILRQSFDLWQVCFIFLTTSFYLSSLGLMIALVRKKLHTAIFVIVGLWTLNLLTKVLLIFPLVHYFYLFIFFTGISSAQESFLNKVILLGAGMACWLTIGIYTKRVVKSSKNEGYDI